MARPTAEVEAEVNALNAWALSMPPSELLSHLTGLMPDDHKLTGQLVQLMCFVDFNARRALRALQAAPGSPGKTKVQYMPDSQVLDLLAAAIPGSPLTSAEKVAALKDVNFAITIANFRHLFAHWAGLKFPKNDALLMMTYNAKEGGKKSDLTVEEDNLVYAVVPLPEVREQIMHLVEISDRLSENAASWTIRYIGK